MHTTQCLDNRLNLTGESHLGTADCAPDNWVPYSLGTGHIGPVKKQNKKKNNEAGNSLNAVERKSVLTRVLNPNTNEASYKPKQRSYKKMKLNFFFP